MKQHQIDPRTTRRTVPLERYRRNSALYSTYEVVTQGTASVVLQKKPQFCNQRKETASC